MTTCFDITG